MKNLMYDEAFYEEVLRDHLVDPTIEVLSVDEEPATAKGENFLSGLLRVRVEFSRISSPGDDVGSRTNETRSFILKHEPYGDSSVLEMVQEQKLFNIELRVLRDIMPRIESALGIRLGPKFVYGTDEPPRAILMEDLAPEGFYIKNRQQGLSMAHATMAIQNLARFHAGSVALAEENPEALRSFRQGIFNASTHPNNFVLAIDSLKRLSKDAATWSHEESDLAAKKLKHVANFIKDRVQGVYEYEADEFCVLNHGDAWVNNILFSEDQSGKPLEQLFVDYQMAGFSSPAVDLLYFLAINPALEVRGKNEEVLLEAYLETLIESMKKLRCKTEPPTMEHLKDAMHRRRAYAIMSGLFLLPRMMLDKDDIEDLDQLLRTGTSRLNVYEKPNTIRMMKRMLPLMNDRGYLDL